MYKLIKMVLTFALVGLIVSIQLNAFVQVNRASEDLALWDNTHYPSSYEQLLPPPTNTEGIGERQLDQTGISGFRTVPNDSPSRVLHYNQLNKLLFLKQDVNYLVFLSQCEKEGYYLYELCKLLI